MYGTICLWHKAVGHLRNTVLESPTWTLVVQQNRQNRQNRRNPTTQHKQEHRAWQKGGHKALRNKPGVERMMSWAISMPLVECAVERVHACNHSPN